MSNLKLSVFVGIIWSFGTRLSLKLLGLISTIVLARLLSPGDFGLMALAMSFYAIVELMGAFGLDVALIQKHGIEDKHLNTAWTVKCIIGVLSAGILYLAAPAVAAFYEEPLLTGLIYTVALAFLLNGVVNIGIVQFQKELDFKTEYIFLMSAKVISFVATMVAAFVLKSYWALVIGFLVSRVATLWFSFSMCAYRPAFTLAASKELFSFSGWIFFNEWLRFANLRLSELVIGKLLNPAAVGIYKVGEEFGSVPANEITASINRASFPGYAKAQKDYQQLRSLFVDVLASIGLISVPAAIGLYIIAPVFVPVVLGTKWMEAIPVLQSIALAGALYSLSANAGSVFLAIGKPKITTFFSACRLLVFVPLLFVMTQSDGVTGAANAYLITSVILTFPPLIYAFHIVSMPFRDFAVAFIGGMIGVLGMLLADLMLSHLIVAWLGPSLLSLVVMVVGYGGLFVVLVLLAWLVRGKPAGLEGKCVELVMQRLPKAGTKS